MHNTQSDAHGPVSTGRWRAIGRRPNGNERRGHGKRPKPPAACQALAARGNSGKLLTQKNTSYPHAR